MRTIRSRGFSLIELLVVVTIIGILASIAIPAYNDYLIKSRRGAAKAFMMQVATKEEEFFNSTRNYAMSITDPLPTGLGLTAPGELSGHYTFSVGTNGGVAGTYLITATATGGQTVDGNLTLDSTGVKSPSGKW